MANIDQENNSHFLITDKLFAEKDLYEYNTEL